MNLPALKNGGGLVARMNEDQLAVLTQQICPKASPTELELFLTVCQRTGLDPFSRQIYGIMRKSKGKDGQWTEKMTIQIAIDGLRTIAQRSGEYEGQTMPQFCGEDGKWLEVWFAKVHPLASRVGVWRKGFREPLWGVAYWSEFAQDTSMWAKMPSTMLAKCAESQALRKAFPHDTMDPHDDAVQAPRAPAIETVTGQVLEDGRYRGTPAHKRALQAAVRALGYTEVDNPTALRELHGMVMGIRLDDLEATLTQIIGDEPGTVTAERGWDEGGS